MRAALIAVCLVLAASPASGQASCQLEGVWQLISGKADGQAYPATWRQMKVITKTHFAFVGEEERGVGDMKTAADSLRAFRTMFAGGGTYTLQGTSYTEKLEYFANPAYLGMAVPFTCRTDGDRLYQTGTLPVFENGRKIREVRLEEVWRRIE